MGSAVGADWNTLKMGYIVQNRTDTPFRQIDHF